MEKGKYMIRSLLKKNSTATSLFDLQSCKSNAMGETLSDKFCAWIIKFHLKMMLDFSGQCARVSIFFFHRGFQVCKYAIQVLK